jgi:hypothetical protein
MTAQRLADKFYALDTGWNYLCHHKQGDKTYKGPRQNLCSIRLEIETGKADRAIQQKQGDS